MKILSFTCILILITSCSSAPVLYPNQKYKSVGKDIAKQDTEECMNQADEFMDSPKGKKILKSAGAGAFIGSAIGAISGIFTGDIAGSAMRSGAIGGAAGAAAGTISPDELKKSFVNKCLRDKGYEITGWN